jgi:MFS family permease
MTGRLAVLGRRDFRLLFGAQAVTSLGDRMVPVALAFAVLELGGSVSEVGIVLAARTFALVASLLIGGVVADRVSRKTVMVVSDLARVVTQGLLAALLIADVADVPTVAVLAAATGLATGFFNPASTGLLPLIVPAEEIQQSNGLRATALSGGEIAGPAIAGVLIAAAGAGWALAIDSVTFAISAALLARMRIPPVAEREATSFLADLRDGWSAFRARTWVWTFVLSAALANLLSAAWNVLGPVVAERDLGGAAAWGGILAAFGVGALLGALIAIRIEPRRPIVTATITFALFSAPLWLVAAGASAPLIAVGALVGGAALMLGNSVWEATLQRQVPAESLSRVSAYDWFGSLAMQPVGMAIWGPISVVIGISTSLWVAGALLVAISLGLLCVPDIRRVQGLAPRVETVPSGR